MSYKNDNFYRPDEYRLRKISAGESIWYLIPITDFVNNMRLGNYCGNVEVGFAGPDGAFHPKNLNEEILKLMVI